MYEDTTQILLLAGPIKYWWDENWGTPEHRRYVAWRQKVNDALVEAGYLVYRPHEAFKGSWDERAQSVNDMALRIANLIINLTPPGIPSEGTDGEMLYAENFGVQVVQAPPAQDFDQGIAALLEEISRLAPRRDAVTQETIKASLALHDANRWMLPHFVEHYQGSVLRVHYFDDNGHGQTTDATVIEVAGAAADAVQVQAGSGDRFTVVLASIQKIEVFDRS